MKTGLVLEGGAMRGMFTAGIMDVLMEAGVIFDGAIGVSAGAAFGVNYKSRQIGRAIRYNMRFCEDKRYCGLRCLLRTGNIYSTEFAYGEVPFHIVCTDVESGQPVYHRWDSFDDHGFDWIRASASMPLVSKIVEIDGQKLLDGGIADSIPLRYFESIGYGRNVVILTQPNAYEKKENGLLFLIRLMYRKYPRLVEAMEKRHAVYNETLAYIAEKEKSGEILVLRPETTLPVSRVERKPERLKAVYDIGRAVAQARLAEIRAFLAAE